MLCYDAACEGENWLAVVTDAAVQQQLLLFLAMVVGNCVFTTTTCTTTTHAIKWQSSREKCGRC